MANEIILGKNNVSYENLTVQNQLEIHLDILDEVIRHRELTRLTEMDIVPFEELHLPPLEEDILHHIRLYRITEMVYQKGESVTDKFTTIFNTLQTYKASVFIIVDSDGDNTDFYLGVRSNGDSRSTVTLGDTLKNALIGHFPGMKLEHENRQKIQRLAKQIEQQRNITSVSVVGNYKNNKEVSNENFVQGLEKLSLAMESRQFTAIIMAQNSEMNEIQLLRKNYQDLYTQLSPYQRVQFSTHDSTSGSQSQSFLDMTGKQKGAMIVGALGGVIGAGIGIGVGKVAGPVGMIVGSQLGASVASLVQSMAPIKQIANSSSNSSSVTTENKAITDMLQLIDKQLQRVNEFDSYGMWNVAAYFISDDMSAAEIAASNYRSLMNGEYSGYEVSAINSWRNDFAEFHHLGSYLSRFVHPNFIYGGSVYTNASVSVSGKELGLHLGLPRTTVPGLPVIEHAEFGKEVNSYQLFPRENKANSKEQVTLGKVFDLGKVSNKVVELDTNSLNMHTFITGSTGSGKSNTVYQLLNELYQDDIPFLVVEPAKGEYKDIFGHWDDVNVYSTNPNLSELIQLNPFKFPESIHVLEHVDGLIEIFSVCWPLYDAMPVFLKDAILKSYEDLGWDLETSIFWDREIRYPNFKLVANQLEKLINETAYSAEVKGNYTGALLTRVKSLTVGLNKSIFTSEQTPYEKIFDENCILDISRVKSSETKSLLMGLIVYMLNEYRMDKKSESNLGLRHVTVLEEAHHLLKNSTANDSDLMQKSVEMLTNTIAEIRTYGEGFVIVDQSPSSVDLTAIKNTNTKIVLRTPEANDRDSVGRSMGLTDDQVNEIAKLPSGVAVVYQNDWISPVLTLIDKANVAEIPYSYQNEHKLVPLKQARTELLLMVMQPFLQGEKISYANLLKSLNRLDLSKGAMELLSKIIKYYRDNGGKIDWNEESLLLLIGLVMEILGITSDKLYSMETRDLGQLIKLRTQDLTDIQIEVICHIMIRKESENGI